MKDNEANKQKHPNPVTTINVRDEYGNKRSKQVSAFKENQDRSMYRPHQGKKERTRRARQKGDANA